MGKSQTHDGLRNAITGTGTNLDATQANAYSATRLTRYDIEQAYLGSGLIRKVIQIPAFDMVREWREWKIDSGETDDIELEEKRHGILQKIKQVEILRGLGGGALILGLPGNPEKLAPDRVGKGGLAFVHVVSRYHLSFQKLQNDATKPGYGEPEMWQIQQEDGQLSDIHPSRVIPFRADTSASLMMTNINTDDAFWGESKVAQIHNEAQASDASRQAFSALLHKARLTRVGIPGLDELLSQPGGENAINRRITTMALGESMHNISIFNSGFDGKNGEEITDVSYNFAGAKDIINVLLEVFCAVSDIPATRLLGRAPEGMNSSGGSQQEDWRKKIRAIQILDLSPCLDRLDKYLVPSALGSTPDMIGYEFCPLDTPSQAENADRFAKQAEAIAKLEPLMAMPQEAFNEGVQSLLVEEGYMPGLQAALEKIPEAERFGFEADPTSPIDPSTGLPITTEPPVV